MIEAFKTVGGVLFVVGMGSVIIAAVWQIWVLWRDRK